MKSNNTNKKIKKKKNFPILKETEIILTIYFENDTIKITKTSHLNEERTLAPITGKEKYHQNILFDKNKIFVGDEKYTDGMISNFINDISNQEPKMKSKTYQIEYQKKQYSLLSEELIALYFYQFKRLIIITCQ